MINTMPEPSQSNGDEESLREVLDRIPNRVKDNEVITDLVRTHENKWDEVTEKWSRKQGATASLGMGAFGSLFYFIALQWLFPALIMTYGIGLLIGLWYRNEKSYDEKIKEIKRSRNKAIKEAHERAILEKGLEILVL